MRQWILIRHGESVANAQGILSGWLDVPLTERGVHQATRVGEILGQWPFEAVWSSDLQRAFQTAQLALAEHKSRTGRSFEVQRSAAFRERFFGPLQGTLKSNLQRDGKVSPLKLWASQDSSIESFDDLARRLLPQMDIATQCSCQVLFAHGGVVRLLAGLIEGKKKAEIAAYHIENATPVVVQSPQQGWTSLMPELF